MGNVSVKEEMENKPELHIHTQHWLKPNPPRTFEEKQNRGYEAGVSTLVSFFPGLRWGAGLYNNFASNCYKLIYSG